MMNLKDFWNICKGKRSCCCCGKGEVEFYGILLLIVGVVSIGAFLLPPKLWLIIVSIIMIYAGFKLFTS